jgi:hypothetical protein
MNTTSFATMLDESRHGRPRFLDRWTSPALLVESEPPAQSRRRATKAVHSNTRTCVATLTAEPRKYPFLENATVAWLEKNSGSDPSELITLGRADDNDLHFELDAISGIHAVFARSGERWYVQDHNSKNGTFVNGERLEPGSPRRLSDGDTVRLGNAVKGRFFAPKALYDFLCIVHRVTPMLEPRT